MDVYKVITSLQDNASASANHNVFSKRYVETVERS